MMRFARNLLAGTVLACATAAAWSLDSPLTFEGLLDADASRPIDPLDLFGGVRFTTFQNTGSPSTLLPGNQSIGEVFQDSFNLGNHVALVLTNANPISTTNPLLSYTEISTPIGTYFTDSFSFRYAAEMGIDVRYTTTSGIESSITTFAALTNGCQNIACGWTQGQVSINLTNLQVASIRFYGKNPSTDPGDFAVIDDITYTRSTMPMVPEPSTYMLMGLGLLGIGFVARRRNT